MRLNRAIRQYLLWEAMLRRLSNRNIVILTSRLNGWDRMRMAVTYTPYLPIPNARRRGLFASSNRRMVSGFCSLHSVFNPELMKDIADVEFYRAFRDKEFLADLSV